MAHSNAAQVGVDRTGKAQVAGDRVGVEHAGVDQAGADPAAKELNYARNYSIKAASADIERFQFNTAISRAMELLNALFKYDADVPDEGKDIPLYAMSLIDLIRLIAPFAPHFAEEAWEGLGLPYSIFGSGNWPSFDESALARDVVEMAVQINGAVRFKIEAPSGAQSSEIEALVRADGRLPQFVLAAAQKGGAGDSGQSNAGGGSPSHAAGKADGSGQSHAGGGAPAGTEASPATHQGGAAASEAAHQGDAAAGEATRQGDAAASPAAHQGDPASGLAASQDGAASGSTTRQENPASGPAARQGDGHGALERISRIIVIKGRLVNVVVG
ncbi:MAG: class I tRNA ligase family protein [Clostridiales bacterium]|nr:class I tRNA ligase family protein [Clostridiales bacterium]